MMAMITTTEEMISKYTSVSLSQSAVCRWNFTTCRLFRQRIIEK
jgi:hypothetical protein